MTSMHAAAATAQAAGAASGAMETRTRSTSQIIRELLPFLWPANRAGLRLRVILAVVAMVLGKLVTVYVPFFYKGAVDQLTAGTGAGDAGVDGNAVALAVAVPVFLVLSYGTARAIGFLFGEVQTAIYARVSEAMQRSLALRLFGHINDLSLRFHLERRTGGLQRIMSRGIYFASALLETVLFRVAPSLLEFIFVAVILTTLFGVTYTAITAATVVAYLVYTFAITEWRKKFRREMMDQDSAAYSRAMDALLNFETVKYFSNERHEAARYDDALSKVEHSTVLNSYSLSALNAGQNVIFTVGLTGLMLLSGFHVVSGKLTVGDFVMVNALLIQLSGPLGNFGFVYRTIREALIDSERMLDVLDTTPEVQDRKDAKPLSVDGGAIRFDHVGFGYDDDRQILRDVDFSVPAGRTVAVVGPTGAGKSTLSRLLFRFYDVQDGGITIDGQDLREVTQDSLRRAIGMVPQDTVLFNSTIGYNIAYGRPDATQDDIERAAKLAQIHDFIATLPKGYDTVVGERGLKLSGGEKQRVAIARTLLKDPPILILDEATSALDTRTEKDIQSALKTVSANRSTLIIAHRLSTVMDADQILVMEKGTVAERGTHTDLLARNGIYAAMWHRQKQQALVSEEEGGPQQVSKEDVA